MLRHETLDRFVSELTVRAEDYIKFLERLRHNGEGVRLPRWECESERLAASLARLGWDEYQLKHRAPRPPTEPPPPRMPPPLSQRTRRARGVQVASPC